jgi:hypothetical protein
MLPYSDTLTEGGINALIHSDPFTGGGVVPMLSYTQLHSLRNALILRSTYWGCCQFSHTQIHSLRVVTMPSYTQIHSLGVVSMLSY